MSLNLMYITNSPCIAQVAENAGVDWIFIDLEINGKEKRQGHLDTVISRHSIGDIKLVKKVLKSAKLLVRINPIYAGSKKEIDRVIEDGADIIMLPFFKTVEEVRTFISMVNGRIKTCLLLETPEAVENLDSILNLNGIDMIHIGLNDLHLGYKMTFMFEPLANGMVEKICKKVSEKNIQFGFGGIAKIGQGMLSAEKIIVEHYRLGSSMAILSRTFCDVKNVHDLDQIEKIFKNGIEDIRNFEGTVVGRPTEFYEQNRLDIKNIVAEIVNSKRKL